MTGDEPLVVFVHIRKTAGLTMRAIVQRQYTRRNTRMVRNYFVDPDRSLEMAQAFAAEPPRGVRAIHGHMLFWPDLPWAAGTRFFTFLRDPVERTISHYSWLRQRNRRLKASLEDALADGMIHDNLQTRVISGTMPFVATEETLDQARANLDRLTAIGLTERFDESLVLLTRVLGWRPMVYSAANATANRPPRETLAPETIETIERYNALDLELYRDATERFARALAAQPDDFAVDVAALQRAKSSIEATPDDAELDRLPAAVAGSHSGSDPRELLIEARAALLLRDAEIERLRARTQRAPARPAEKPQPDPQDRAAALDAAADRARRRVARTRRKLEELEQAGAAAGSTEVERLRADIARAQTRLEGFERRRARLGAPETATR